MSSALYVEHGPLAGMWLCEGCASEMFERVIAHEAASGSEFDRRMYLLTEQICCRCKRRRATGAAGYCEVCKPVTVHRRVRRTVRTSVPAVVSKGKRYSSA